MQTDPSTTHRSTTTSALGAGGLPGSTTVARGPLLHGWQRLRPNIAPAVAIAAIAALVLLDHTIGGHGAFDFTRDRVSYGLLFVAGLLTGFHCIGMCGALVLSYSTRNAQAPASGYRAHLLYGLGKTISYTVLGALFGMVGGIITFTPTLRGAAGAVAGAFLVVFGLSLLRVFKGLDRFGLKTPGFLLRFIGREYRRQSHPLVIGLLNGLMILCGPLQAMYILAAGTGSALAGAKALLVFGLGTLPVMLGFGMLTSVISRQLAPKLLKASGCLVIGLGLLMFDRGLVMVGSGYDFRSLYAAGHEVLFGAAAPTTTSDGVQTIHMRVTQHGYQPSRFQVQPGMPVRWVIDVEQLTYCNSGILAPKLGIDLRLQPGRQVVEFTPQEAGTIGWSCWMGMLPGSFSVRAGAADVSHRVGLVPRARTAVASAVKPLTDLPERTVVLSVLLVIGLTVSLLRLRQQWNTATRKASFRASLAGLLEHLYLHHTQLPQVMAGLAGHGASATIPPPLSHRDYEMLAAWAAAEGWLAEQEWLLKLSRQVWRAERVQAGEQRDSICLRRAAPVSESSAAPLDAMLTVPQVYQQVDRSIRDYLGGGQLPVPAAATVTLHASDRWFRLISLLVLIALALLVHATAHSQRAEPRRATTQQLVRVLGLTDLALFTEASYTRHPSQADVHAAFQDHPLAFDHFPSGSWVDAPACVLPATTSESRCPGLPVPVLRRAAPR